MWDILPPARLIHVKKKWSCAFYEWRIEQQQKKEDFEMEELLQIQRDSLNTKLGNDILFINPKIPKNLM